MPDGSIITNSDFLGVGIYTPASACQFTGVNSSKIRRWLKGSKDADPLWESQIPNYEENVYLGFRDLTEIRVASTLLKAGLSPQRLRRAIQIAERKHQLVRPLSTTNFKTDGKAVFLELAKEENTAIINIFTDQYQIKDIIIPSLKGLEFNENGEPTRWNIAPSVVIDPDFSFGQPTEKETHVPTSVLANAAAVEGSVKMAARIYDVPVLAVKRAIDFEKAINAKALN